MSPSPMIIQYWALKRLLPPSRKLRKNDPAVNRMAASIEEAFIRTILGDFVPLTRN